MSKELKNFIVSELELLEKRQIELIAAKNAIVNNISKFDIVDILTTTACRKEFNDLKREYDDLIVAIFNLENKIKLLKKILNMIDDKEKTYGK